MKITDDILLIQKFQDELLTEEELSYFRNKFNSDPVFAEKVKEYTDTVIFLKAARKIRFQTPVPAIQKSSNAKTFTLKRYLVAASILFFILSSSIYFNSGESAHELGKDKFIPVRLSIHINREGTTNVQNKLQLAQELYYRNDKEKAIQLLLDLTASNPTNAQYHFILGDMFFENENPTMAIYHYDQGLNYESDDSYAQWNKAMAYLVNFDIDRAKESLNKIAQNEEGYLNEKAKKLLNEINSLKFKLNFRNMLKKK